MGEKRYDVLLKYCENPSSFSRDSMDETLVNAWRQTGIRELYIYEKLKKVIGAFEERQIPVIVLKGALLAKAVYPFGVRPFDDIDLLVKPEHFDEINNVLQKLGYADTAYSIPLWTHQDFANKVTYHEKDRDVNIPVDLHFSLGPHPYLGRLSRELLWKDAEKFEIEGMNLYGLKAEVQLLHLCLHLFQHLNESWISSCCDMASVIRYYEDSFDWDLFADILRSTGTVLPVRESLKRMQGFFGELVPMETMKAIEEIKTSSTAKTIFSYSKRNSEQMDRFFIQYISTPGLGMKLRCLKQALLPNRKFVDRYCTGSYKKYYAKVMRSFKNIFRSALK